jgi:SagB-type dehydrogenase family enzyme
VTVVDESHEILPELARALADMAPDEQEVLLRALERSRRTMGPTTREMTLLHGAMKVDGLALSFNELAAAKAEPVVRRFPDAERFELPRDMLPLEHPLERVLGARASRRDFTGEELALRTLATLLHFSYGVRKTTMAYNLPDLPLRFAPTAGGLQSVELYAIVNAVEGLPRGAYHYDPLGHAVELVNAGNMRRRIVSSATRQEWLRYTSVALVLSVRPERLDWKYGARGYRLMHMDLGFVGQNICLVATALGLRTTPFSGIDEDDFNAMLRLDGDREYAALMFPIGARGTGRGTTAHVRAEEEW